jgi:serine/threonine-protein kinase
MMHQVINEMPSPPSSHVADLPAELDAMTMKAIAKRPEQRFATALSWRNALLVLHDTLKDRLDPDHTVIAAKLPRKALEPLPVAASDLSGSFLATLEERLASHVGPIASLLVRRAASQATEIHERSPRSWPDICPTKRLAANGAPCSSSI